MVADLPVGDNLQDHVVADGAIFYTEHGVSVSPARAENFLSSWAYSIYGGGECVWVCGWGSRGCEIILLRLGGPMTSVEENQPLP